MRLSTVRLATVLMAGIPMTGCVGAAYRTDLDLSGVVTDAQGEPVPHVAVNLRCRRTHVLMGFIPVWWGTESLAETKATERGAFKIRTSHPGGNMIRDSGPCADCNVISVPTTLFHRITYRYRLDIPSEGTICSTSIGEGTQHTMDFGLDAIVLEQHDLKIQLGKPAGSKP